jgi:pyruvate formate lyase activating enzyme
MSEQKILITEIERCALHDGPGIRSVVFFKGCPLRCFWCCNPETQQQKKELMRSEKDCVRCGACADVCENGCAKHSEDGNISFLRDNCRACGSCAEACPSGALGIAGEEADIETIVRRVLRDRDYYEASGGGVTLSGGEPFFQAEGVLALLAALKDEKLHTAVETTGAVCGEVLQRAATLTDVFLYDLKHSDPARFREGCGGDLPLIISNLKSIVGAGADVLVRTPVIPGFNDDPKVLEGIFEIAREAGVKSVRLLPYHALGRDKYKKLGREYPPGDMPMTDKKELEPLLSIGRNMGLEAAMGD